MTFWLWLKAIGREWKSLIGGGIMVIAVATWEHWTNASVPITAYGVMLSIAVLWACYEAWVKEHCNYIAELEANQKPELKIDVTHIRITRHHQSSLGPTLYVRLTVTNARRVPTSIRGSKLRIRDETGKVHELLKYTFSPPETVVEYAIHITHGLEGNLPAFTPMLMSDTVELYLVDGFGQEHKAHRSVSCVIEEVQEVKYPRIVLPEDEP